MFSNAAQAADSFRILNGSPSGEPPVATVARALVDETNTVIALATPTGLTDPSGASLGTFNGAYANLTGKPTLGALAALDTTAAVLVTDATTARTLGLTDTSKYLRFTNASAVSVTVPTQASVVWLGNEEIYIEQAGAGLVTVIAAGGVTVHSFDTLKSAGQYAVLKLKRISADLWTLSGRTSAT